MDCIANIIRGATLLSRFDPCPLQDTNISPATDVCPHVAEYSAKILITFSHLTAPSAVHLTTCFRPDSQHAQALCTGIIAVISASTVCMLMYYSIYNSSCQMFYKSFEKNPVSKKMVRLQKVAAPCSKNRSIKSYFVRKNSTCHLPYDLEKLLTHNTFRYCLHQRHGYSQCLTITVNLQFQRISSRFGIQHFL